MYDAPLFAPQGWQCPICGRVYSPTTSMCFSCGNGEVVTTNRLEIKGGTPVRDLMINGGDWHKPEELVNEPPKEET